MKRLVILLVAAAGVGAVAWGSRAPSPPAPVAAVHHLRPPPRPAVPRAAPGGPAAAPVAAPPAVAANAALARLRPRLAAQATHDPFTASSWLPPPPPPPPPAPPPPPPAPVAPPLPFTFVGAEDVGTAKARVFLNSGDRLLIVTPGEVIEGRYRLESLTPNSLVFTYLPLQQKQTLIIETEGK
jgi:hypothetical protein